MEKITINKIVIGAIIGVFIFIVICFILYIPHEIQTKLDSNYPHLKYNDEVFGKVEKIKVNRGTIYFDLKNNLRFKTYSSNNFNYSPFSIDDFIIYDDSVYKPKNSDSLFVFRDKKRYFFILEKDINEK